jgi:GNAT superfamily N-acetyltransferase
MRKQYHGTTEESAHRILREGLRLDTAIRTHNWPAQRVAFAADTPEYARLYGDSVVELEIVPGAKTRSVSMRRLFTGGRSLEDSIALQIPKWRAAGLDIVFVPDQQSGVGNIILNPGVLRPLRVLGARTHNPPLLPSSPQWDPTWVIGFGSYSPSDREIIIFDKNVRRIGHLTLLKSRFERGAWRVGSIRVKDEHRGKGMGQALYLIALKLLGRIHPDWENSVDITALRAWQALQSRYLVRQKLGAPFLHGVEAKREGSGACHVHLTPEHWVAFPPGWEGVLDQVYELTNPESVELAELSALRKTWRKFEAPSR